jgi:hypothetical protein
MPRKPNSDQIRQKVDELCAATWLDESQRWWPKFLFHFTDVRNAASILDCGALRSRTATEASGQRAVDCASADVLSHTSDEVKRSARLYMKPRTPMQFNTEGFRPLDRIHPCGAHCPMPIVFLFDSKEILTLTSTRFSDGNLSATIANVGDTADFYCNLPFQSIYHDRPVSGDQTRQIVHHRHAEVFALNEISLVPGLRRVWCRSEAERETLLNLLSTQARRRWKGMIGLGSRIQLFYEKYPFVTNVELDEKRVKFRFHSGTIADGTFKARMKFDILDSDRKYKWESDEFRANEPLDIDLIHDDGASYEVRLLLDGNLAYFGRYIHADEEEIPF